MTTPAPPLPARKAAAPFAAAAAAYALGVAVLVAWLYALDRSAVLGQIDARLVQAAFAARAIVEEGGEAGGLAGRPGRGLGRFAEECGVELLGVFDRHADGAVAAADLADGGHPAGSISRRLPTLLPPDARAAGDGAAALHTVEDPDLGSVRVAILGGPEGLGRAYVAAEALGGARRRLRIHMAREAATGLLLLALAAPLFVLSYRMQHRSARELARLNERLRQDVEHRKTREGELKDAIRDLERFNAVAVGREARIIELKAEVNELLMESSRRKRYNIEQID